MNLLLCFIYLCLLTLCFIDCGVRNIVCQVGEGHDYRGDVKETHGTPLEGFVNCTSWKGNDSVHWEWYNKTVRPDQPDNLCRNPENSAKDGIWCFTNADHTESNMCQVRRCTDCDTGNFLVIESKIRICTLCFQAYRHPDPLDQRSWKI